MLNQEERQILQRLCRSSQPPTIALHELCFDKQLAFIQDHNLFAMAVTSRRAGKTTACALHLLDTAIKHPKSVCLYITTARTNAKKIIWPIILELNRANSLGGESNESDLSLTFTNGSRIYISGAATASEVDRFRGLALKLVYVDEAQSFGAYLSNLIDDVLEPACFDNRGAIRIIGTPGPVPVGYYYEIWSGIKADGTPIPNVWGKHSWTIFDNPWIEKKRGETPQEVLQTTMARRGVTQDDPTIQREIFGRFVVDTKRLVFDYDRVRNHFDTLPFSKFHYLMGIDLGYEDSDALAILAYSDVSPITYLVDELITPKQGFTELIQQIELLRKKYNPYKLMIDAGGLGKKLAEEMRRRHRIPVQDADKTRKFETIEFLNDALRTKRFMAKRASRFANDTQLVEWDFDKMRPDKKVVSDRFHSDICDAVLYAFKESPAYAWEVPILKPKVGTPEWGKEQEREMFEQALEHFKNKEIPNDMEWL